MTTQELKGAKLSNLFKLGKTRPRWARVLSKMCNRAGIAVTAGGIFLDSRTTAIVALVFMVLADGFTELYESTEAQTEEENLGT